MLEQTYIPETSAVHELDFWTKFLCFLIILPLTAFLSAAPFLPIIVLVFFLFLILSKISLWKFWRMTKLYNVPITIGVVALSLAFTPGAWQERVFSGLVLAVRFVLLISFGVFFSAVTNPIEIPGGFLRAKIPHKYGVTLMVGFRMMPLLAAKIRSIVDAQRARGADLTFSLGKIPKLIPQFTALMVPILHSTLETSVRLSDALISRGYNPEGKITVTPGKLKMADFFLVFAALGILILSLRA